MKPYSEGISLGSINWNKKTDDDFRQQWIERNDSLSADGLRVIAFAYKEEDKK